MVVLCSCLTAQLPSSPAHSSDGDPEARRSQPCVSAGVRRDKYIVWSALVVGYVRGLSSASSRQCANMHHEWFCVTGDSHL